MSAMLIGTLLAVALAGGCSNAEGEKCVGGVIEADGTCAAKCDPAKCLPGNTCVENECRLLCSSHNDCLAEVQSCVQGVDDATSAPVLACAPTGRARVVPWLGTGTMCPFGHECDLSFCPDGSVCDPLACNGNPAACVGDPATGVGACSTDGTPCVPSLCALTECKTALYCPNGLQCDPLSCGGQPDACEKSCDGEHCNEGTCSNTGEPCVFNTCDPTHCSTMVCNSAGQGDADAYCAPHDCSSDDECAPGFSCGVTRDPRTICGATCAGGSCSTDSDILVTLVSGMPLVASTSTINCTSDLDCQKGNNDFCGRLGGLEDCVDPAEFTTAGKTFSEGQLCLLRNSCLRSDSCSTCETNLDCNDSNTDVCQEHGGEKICARFCGDESDCRNDEFCVPADSSTCSQNSGVRCSTDDECPTIADSCPLALGAVEGTCTSDPSVTCASDHDCPRIADVCTAHSVCVPASGSCSGDPGNADPYCHHCVDDTDCGGPDSTSVCATVDDGEQACVNMTWPAACTEATADSCPDSPSGDKAFCVSNPSHPLFERCFLPLSPDSDGNGVTPSCWPEVLPGG